MGTGLGVGGAVPLLASEDPKRTQHYEPHGVGYRHHNEAQVQSEVSANLVVILNIGGKIVGIQRGLTDVWTIASDCGSPSRKLAKGSPVLALLGANAV